MLSPKKNKIPAFKSSSKPQRSSVASKYVLKGLSVIWLIKLYLFTFLKRKSIDFFEDCKPKNLFIKEVFNFFD
ncbi:hypothetical protein GCM10010984_05830 [Chishuiella changwenlii]|uniref:Uncharacterized protein n=1 Tax=Chishuiella changwenlii TaxID=1434701 RepID=A0ABQ1TE38_9FLAO|nr:hypothetical protein GCM10010984_05830 [Chishuiella changwenlii]